MAVALHPQIDFEHTKLQQVELSQCRMVLSAGTEGLSYVVTDAEHTLLAARHYLNEAGSAFERFLSDVRNEDSLLGRDFATYQFLSNAQRWLVVPNELYSPARQREYLATIHQLAGEEDAVFSESNRQLNLVTLFAIDATLTARLNELLNYPQFKHLINRAIRQTDRMQRIQKAEFFAQVLLVDKLMLYIVFNEEALYFANLFPLSSAEEVIRNLTNVNLALEIPQEELRLVLTGQSPFRAQAFQDLTSNIIYFLSTEDFFPADPEFEAQSLQPGQLAHLYLPA